MIIHLLGVPDRVPTFWQLSRIPPQGGAELSDLLFRQLTDYLGADRASRLRFRVGTEALEVVDAEGLKRLATAASQQTGAVTVVAVPLSAREPTTRHGASMALVTESGPDSGRLIPLHRRAYTLGRHPADIRLQDPTVSRLHALVDVRSHQVAVTDLRDASAHSHFQAGATRYAIRHAGDPVALPAMSDPIPNDEVDVGSEPTTPNLVMQAAICVMPVVIGVLMVVLTGRWYFMLFSLASVVLTVVLVAQYLRATRRFIRRITKEKDELVQAHQLRALRPSDLMLIPEAPPATGSEQNPTLTLGSATTSVELRGARDQERWDPHREIRAPVTIPLPDGGTTVLAGSDAPSLRCVARWCVAQLVWQATARSDTAGTKTRVAVVEESGHVTWYGAYASREEPGRVIVVDYRPDAQVPAHSLLEPGTMADHVIQLTHSPTSVEAGTVIDLSPDTLQIRIGDRQWTNLEPIGISAATLQLILHRTGTTVPPALGSQHVMELPEVLGCHHGIARLVAQVGADNTREGVDLVGDGPHLLIAGTTGSGKSELLLTLLVSIMMRYPPAEVAMVLLDFKGGASFGVLEQLPHVMSVETNLADALSLRSFDAVRAELRRREQLFLERGVPDYSTFRKRFPHEVLPRLIVAIDELKVLVDEYPEASALLARLAATGRSLGFHLVMSTQRPQGAVTSEIRSNIGTVLALRTATEQESWDLVGDARAYKISPHTPGRGFIATGAAEQRPFQVARVIDGSEPTSLYPLTESGKSTGSQASAVSPTTAWDSLLARVAQRYRRAGVVVPESIILPALPEHLTVASATTAQGSALVLGRVDDPAHKTQWPLCLAAPDTRGGSEAVSSLAVICSAAGGAHRFAAALISQVQGTGQVSRGYLMAPGEVMSQPWLRPERWIIAEAEAQTPDSLEEYVSGFEAQLSEGSPVCLVIVEWNRFGTVYLSSSYQSVEDRLVALLQKYPRLLQVVVVGGKELASGKLLGMIPPRVYVPSGFSVEHRALWPKLTAVPELPLRGVLTGPGIDPEAGLAIQLVEP